MHPEEQKFSYGNATTEPHTSQAEQIEKQLVRFTDSLQRLEDRLRPVLGPASPIAQVSEKVSGSVLAELCANLADKITYLEEITRRIEA